MQGPGKSWNFLGYDVGGGHSDAGADAKIHIKIFVKSFRTICLLFLSESDKRILEYGWMQLSYDV